jgi:hypothetical protein
VCFLDSSCCAIRFCLLTSFALHTAHVYFSSSGTLALLPLVLRSLAVLPSWWFFAAAI